MRFKNEKIQVRATSDVLIPRASGVEPLKFKVASLPIGIDRMYEIACPRPEAPLQSVTVKKGVAPEKVFDYDNKEFLISFSEWRDLRKYFVVYQAIAHDSDWAFEHPPRDMKTLREFVEELREAGLSDGDLNIIYQKALALSNITAGEIAEAKASF